MTLEVPPSSLPVSLAEARDACQIFYSGDDVRLDQLIHAATDYLDGWDGILGRAIMPQTWRMHIEGTRWQEIDLPLPPFRELVSISWYGEDGLWTAFDPLYYRVIPGTPATVLIGSDAAAGWVGDIEIIYRCGYLDVPESLRAAILMLVRHWYDNPGAVTSPNFGSATLPFACDALLSAFRIQSI